MSGTSQYASDGTTLVEVIRRFESDGYTAQMAAVEGCTIRCFACHTDSPAEDVALDGVRRTEGASDPADMVAVVALRCPACGARGTVALKYGPLATPEEAEVLALVDTRGSGPQTRPPA